MLKLYTVPIAVEYGGKVAPHCTAMLFKCGELHFLVTAAHCITSAHVENKAELFVPSDLSPTANRIQSQWFYYKPTSMMDVAATKLDDEMVQHLSKHRWAHTQNFVKHLPSGKNVYCATRGLLACESEGWEASDARPDATLSSCVFISKMADVPKDSEGWNQNLHAAAIGNSRWAMKSDGSSRNVPVSLKGLSGSPACVFVQDPYSNNFALSDFQVIGFQSSISPLNDENKTKLLKLVRWEVAYSLIAGIYPAVQEVGRAYGLRFGGN